MRSTQYLRHDQLSNKYCIVFNIYLYIYIYIYTTVRSICIFQQDQDTNIYEYVRHHDSTKHGPNSRN